TEWIGIYPRIIPLRRRASDIRKELNVHRSGTSGTAAEEATRLYDTLGDLNVTLNQMRAKIDGLLQEARALAANAAQRESETLRAQARASRTEVRKEKRARQKAEARQQKAAGKDLHKRVNVLRVVVPKLIDQTQKRSLRVQARLEGKPRYAGVNRA